MPKQKKTLPIKHVTITPPHHGASEKKLGEAEVAINEDTLEFFRHAKLVRFNIWRAEDGSVNVTMPCVKYGQGKGKYWDLLRAVDGQFQTLNPLRELIRRAYQEKQPSRTQSARRPAADAPRSDDRTEDESSDDRWAEDETPF